MSSNNRIHALPLHLANQIAAGEVIERPASVVKELIENSIDAQATQIDIDIEGSGSQLICIKDNGIGIHPDDLVIALSRHATSKIHSSEQLSHIDSLGFRGEALPSIASISQLTLTSRQVDNEYAYQLSGNNTNITPASHSFGTSFEVRDLFFNLPARRHFLSSNKTEQHHILTTIQRLALSQFNIGFHYRYENETKLKLAPANTIEQQQQRIAKICGNAFIQNSLYIQQKFDNIELKGWLGKAEAHRPRTDVQYFFINGRVIRDRVINHAIRQAYGEFIPAGRQAAYVLYLTVPLESVDINVHPTKHEVRFRNARLIHGLIISAIQEALGNESTEEPIISHSKNKVEEQAQTYHSLPSTTLEDTNNADLGQVLNVLEQRYIISQTTKGLLLLDLQYASQQLRCQQLSNAIHSDSLRARPILVPIIIPMNDAQIDIARQYASRLECFAIKYQLKSSGLMVTEIPSLLSHIDIQHLIHSIVAALLDGKTSKNQLITVLQALTPLVAIENIDQAKQLIKQINMIPITNKWCVPLDRQALSSLF